MDEVLAVGDANFQNKCIEEFEKYKQNGRTVILVSHDIIAIREYCDRALLLNNGKIITIGESEHVTGNYINNITKEEGERLKKENHEIKRIKDETNRIEINLTEKSGETFGSKKAIIESYKILNHEAMEDFNLETGKEFTIKLKIKIYSEVNDITFGLMFRKNPNENLFGLHSLYSENPIRIEKLKRGDCCTVIISDMLILTPGTYFLSLYCASQETYIKYELLDSFENSIKVNVFGNKDYWGSINTGKIKMSVIVNDSFEK